MLPDAIVLDSNQRAALATIRSLGRMGVRVLAAESSRRSLGSSSRFSRSALLYPDPSKFPDAFADWLEDAGHAHPGAVLMPMTDLTVPLVLQNAARISSLRTALPSLEAYEAVTDKYRLFHFARSVGVRVPETAAVTRATLDSLRDIEFRYPVVVKPRISTARGPSGAIKRPIRYAKDPADLHRIVQSELLDDADELLLQEYIQGTGAGVFGLYESGQPRCFFSHRRIREKPPSGGISVLCESVPLPEAGLQATRAILDPLHWNGVAMAEFKIDADGRFWLIEINARFWGSLQLAIDCDMDFPALVYQIAAGKKVTLASGYTSGRQLRWWLGDLDNLYMRLRDSRYTPTVWEKAVAIGEFALPWRPGMRYEFLRFSDALPALRGFQQYLDAVLHNRGSSR